MNPLSADQQVRMQLAITYKINEVDKLENIYRWVMGPQTSILPARNFEVVKQ